MGPYEVVSNIGLEIKYDLEEYDSSREVYA